MLFFYILIAHLFEVHAQSECVPLECLKCSLLDANVTAACNVCLSACDDGKVPDNCTRDFSVSINSTGSKVEESEHVTLICVHDLPEKVSVTYEWRKDSVEEPVGKEREYIIKKAFAKHVGSFVCEVHSECGDYTSEPHDVTIENNNIVILVICGCSALGVIVLMGGCMKFKMHRDKIKNQKRTRERMQEMRRAQDLPRP